MNLRYRLLAIITLLIAALFITTLIILTVDGVRLGDVRVGGASATEPDHPSQTTASTRQSHNDGPSRFTAGRQNPRQKPHPNKSTPLLCVPDEDVSRLTDEGLIVAADPGGRFAFYANPEARPGHAYRHDSLEILTDCLPQLTYTNLATVLVEGRGPENARPANIEDATKKTPDDSLTTAFGFPKDITLEQELSLKDGGLEARYTLSNNSSEDQSVSLRTLLTPAPDLHPSRDGRRARFVLDTTGARRPVDRQTETAGEEIRSLSIPRRGSQVNASAQLLPGPPSPGRRPDVVAFAGTLDLTAAEFRTAQATDDSPWPLPPLSSIALYWLYENLAPGDSVTFSYRYKPTAVPPEGRRP